MASRSSTGGEGNDFKSNYNGNFRSESVNDCVPSTGRLKA